MLNGDFLVFVRFAGATGDPYGGLLRRQQCIFELSSFVGSVVRRHFEWKREFKNHSHLRCPNRDARLSVNIEDRCRGRKNQGTKNWRHAALKITHPSGVAFFAWSIDRDIQPFRSPFFMRARRSLGSNLESCCATMRTTAKEKSADPSWPSMFLSDARMIAKYAKFRRHGVDLTYGQEAAHAQRSRNPNSKAGRLSPRPEESLHAPEVTPPPLEEVASETVARPVGRST